MSYPDFRVYKYELALNGTHLRLPEKAEILSVAEQGPWGRIYAWARVDVNAAGEETRDIHVRCTGEWCGDGKHIGTVHMRNGDVLHVFEDKP